jgi:glycosyltransferase involved in cell wall biosynthesis
VLDDPGLQRALAEGGRRRALERYTWEAAANATVREYMAVINRC